MTRILWCVNRSVGCGLISHQKLLEHLIYWPSLEMWQAWLYALLYSCFPLSNTRKCENAFIHKLVSKSSLCLNIFPLSFTFPSVLMMYPTLAVLLVAILDLFSFLPIDSHLCSSDDFLENISSGKSSTFVCKLKGRSYYSVTLIPAH